MDFIIHELYRRGPNTVEFGGLKEVLRCEIMATSRGALTGPPTRRRRSDVYEEREIRRELWT